MTIEALAELFAVHLWAVLCIVTSVMLVLAWLLWHAIQRYGPHVASLGLARRLSVQVLASAAFAVTALVGFVEVADEIALDEDLGRFDAALSNALSRHASDVQLRMFATLTDLGDKRLLIPLAAAVALLLFVQRRRILAATWVVATAAGGLLNTALKAIFERSRPEHPHGFASADGWSFPSGHAAGAFIIYGLLAYLVMIHVPKRFHLLVAVVAMALIVCVGLSRVILQVHYFSDVLGGYAFGASWVAAWIAGIEAFRRRQPRGELAQKN